MKRICPFSIVVALAATGCVSRKPAVQTSAMTMRSDSLNLTVDCLSTATLHDITVIPADTMRDIVHIGRLELDRHTRAETSAVSAETIAESRSEVPPPVSRNVSLRWLPWIFILAAGVIIFFRK